MLTIGSIVKYKKGSRIYTVTDIVSTKVVILDDIYEANISQLVEYDKNKLQREKDSQSVGGKSRTCGELYSGNSLCFELGYRGNEYCVDQSPERVKRCYEHLPLGHQKVSGHSDESGELSEKPRVDEESSRTSRNSITLPDDIKSMITYVPNGIIDTDFKSEFITKAIDTTIDLKADTCIRI